VTRQRTIKDTVAIEGRGLQTGGKARLVLKGSPADSGINFIRADLPTRPLVSVRSLDLASAGSNERRTTVASGPVEIHTAEHLLAALSGLSIDNITAEIDGAELPGMDGSAREFVAALKKAGIVEQDAPKRTIEIKEPLWCRDEEALLAAFPDENLRISYTLSYEDPAIGTQFFDILVNEESFTREIAPARTFCRKAEALALLASGLGKGASHRNTLIMGRRGPFGNRLRFPNEPARHKALDLMGDLYLAGASVKGRIVAVKSGHRLNIELARRLKQLV
jgi:UDP-3-O-[3-hydroxymyristoyl] N-acetylglucosamine deacetylase/3-hydroxyacyl-[acyl-carrier-protein] dehydratase